MFRYYSVKLPKKIWRRVFNTYCRELYRFLSRLQYRRFGIRTTRQYLFFSQILTATVLIVLVIVAGPQVARAGPHIASAVIGQSSFSGYLPDSASISANGMFFPDGSVYDTSHHRLFVSDTANNRVLVYDTSSGITTGMAASYVIGQPDFSSDGLDQNGSEPSATTLANPRGLAYDAVDQLLFVADSNAGRVLVYDVSSGISNDMAASYELGQADMTSSVCDNQGNSTASSLCEPDNVYYDSGSHQLFVSDTNDNRVVIYDLSGGITNDMAASYELGQPDFSSDIANQDNGNPSAITVAFPRGLVYDAADQYLFVADQGNSRVLTYDLSGGITNDMAASYEFGQSDFFSNSCAGGSTTTLCNPQGVTYDAADQLLFVADTDHSRTLIYDLSGGISNDMAASNVIGQPDLTSYDCEATTISSTCATSDVSYDPTTQDLFISDTSENRLLVFDLSGGITDGMAASYVLGQPNFTGNLEDGASVTASDLNSPSGVAYDTTHHRMFVVDEFNSRLLIYDTSSGITTGMAASYELGQPNFADTECNTGGRSASTLCDPLNVAYSAVTNQLFVSDSSNARVLVYDLSGGITDGMAASYELGQINVNSASCTGTITASTLCFPAGLTYDATSQRLFVGDNSNYRVLVYDLSGGITDGMAASYVLGQSDFSSGNCNGVSAYTICDAGGMTYDSADHYLFIASNNPARVLVYDLSGGITDGMAATWVLGEPDLSSSNSCNSITITTLCNPYGLSYDSADHLLVVSDTAFSRIMVYDLSGGITDGMAAVDVIGQPNYSSFQCDQAPDDATTICNPLGLAYDADDSSVVVADGSSSRVLEFPLTVHITTSSLADGETDVPYDQSIQTLYGHSPETFSITSGSLPDGLSLNSVTGAITGTPTTAATYNFTVQVVDNQSYTDSQSLSIEVDPGVQITTSSLPPAVQNIEYDNNNAAVYITNGNGPYTYSLISGDLPPGISLDSSSGAITGTPTTVGNFNFTVEVSDVNGATADQALSIDVSAAANYLASGVLGQPNLTSAASNYGGNTGLASPQAVVSDATDHLLFVADTQDDRVLIYNTSAGISAGMSASYELGQPDLTTNGCLDTPTASSLCWPEGLAYDTATDQLFVSDDYNARIMVYDLSGGITDGMAASYVLGHTDFTTSACNSGSSINDAGLCYPVGISFNATTDQLAVADDSNSRTVIYDLSGGITDGMSASYELGQADFTTNNCLSPAINDDCYPSDVSFDSTNNSLFVADTTNNRVLVYDLSGGITDGMAASYELGEPDFTSRACTDSSPLTASSICTPMGVAYDSATQQLFVSDQDNSRVLVYDLSGGITDGMAASYVLGAPDLTTPGCDITSNTSLCSPHGLAYDPSLNELFVSDMNNDRIMVYDLSGGITDGMDASYELGQPDFSSESNSLFQTNANGLEYPVSETIDTVHHHLFVSDSSNNRVLIYNLSTTNTLVSQTPSYVLGQTSFTGDECNGPTEVESATTLCDPLGVSYDPTHNFLYVADPDNGRLLVYDLSGGITTGMAASYVLGEPDMQTTDYATSQNLLDCPAGISYDASHQRLFVSDECDSRVVVYDLSGGITDGMDASYVLGQADFTSYNSNQNGSPAANTMYDPDEITYDSSTSMLYVADSGNGRVLIYDLSGGISSDMNASYVLGEPDFVTTADVTSQSGLDCPAGISYDASHQRLFVSDECDSRVVVYDLSGGITNGMDASDLLGQPGYTQNDENQDNDTPSASTLADPVLITYDPLSSTLWVADGNNNRLLTYNFAHITTTTLPQGLIDTSYSQPITEAGSQGTVSYAIVSGNLPAGVTLNSSTGRLTGTPLLAGSYAFSVGLTDDNGVAGIYTDTHAYSLVILAAAVAHSVSASSGSSKADTIVLNNLADFFSSSGVTITNLTVGEQLHLCISATATSTCNSSSSNYHTITVKSIDLATNSVTLTFASTPFDVSFVLNQPQDVDLNHDGVNDIRVMLTGLTATTADFNFVDLLASSPVAVSAQTTTPSHLTPAHAATPHRSALVWWIGGGGIAIILLLVVSQQRRRHTTLDHSNPTSL